MAGFTAEGVVDALDFDFRPYVNAHGTIAEPTDAQIGQFLKDVREIIKSSQGELPAEVAGDDPVALLKALDELEPDQVVKMMSRMAGAYAGLCGGTPTQQEIADLPMRVRQIFFNWLQAEVMAPEAGSAAGNVRALSPRSSRAG